MAKISARIVDYIIKQPWPSDLAFINVNFPTRVSNATKIHITYPVLYKYDNYMVEKADPRGLPYLWLWGKRKEHFPEGSDAWAVIDQGSISITPIAFNMYDKSDRSQKMLQGLKENITI